MRAPPSVRAIVAEVAERWNVPVEMILAYERGPRIDDARREAMALVRDRVVVSSRPPSYTLMGRWFGRHHTTIVANVQKYREISANRPHLIRFPVDRFRFAVEQSVSNARAGV